MADIAKAESGNDIKNGTIVVSTKVTGLTDKDVLDTYVLNTPNLASISGKYDDRFDDPSYYFGDGTLGT